MVRLSEYRAVVEVLELAVASFDTYNDKYIKIIVRDAQLLVADANNKRYVDRRVYSYSATLSKMLDKKRLCSYNPEALSKQDFKDLLAFFSSL